MTNFFNEFKRSFSQKDILMKFILINIIVFVLVNIIVVVSTLFKLDIARTMIDFIAIPADINRFIFLRPWTIITYMFVHQQFFHILFNMLVLFWFGRIFLNYFNSKNLGNLYVMGGISGALLYILAFNTIPYYLDMGNSHMIGASASVTAILFAAAFYRPDTRVNLFFFGSIKIIYIALALFLIDFVSLASSTNPGGAVAHIGGAIIGYLYAMQFRKGRDILSWLNKPMDAIANLFKPRPPKMKVKKKTTDREADYEYNKKRREDMGEIDQILDKIKASGYGSLSADEKKRLFDASKK